MAKHGAGAAKKNTKSNICVSFDRSSRPRMDLNRNRMQDAKYRSSPCLDTHLQSEASPLSNAFWSKAQCIVVKNQESQIIEIVLALLIKRLDTMPQLLETVDVEGTILVVNH